jgi:hypothetical protein
MGILEILRNIVPQPDTSRTDVSPTLTASSLFGSQHSPSTSDTSPPTSAHPSAKGNVVDWASAPPSQGPDAQAIASDWLSQFSTALFTGDEASLRVLFTPAAAPRDSLGFFLGYLRARAPGGDLGAFVQEGWILAGHRSRVCPRRVARTRARHDGGRPAWHSEPRIYVRHAIWKGTWKRTLVPAQTLQQ